MVGTVSDLPSPDTWLCLLGLGEAVGSEPWLQELGWAGLALPWCCPAPAALGAVPVSLSSFFQGTSLSFRQEPDSSCVNIQAEINPAAAGVTLPCCLLQHFVFVSCCTPPRSSRSKSHV